MFFVVTVNYVPNRMNKSQKLFTENFIQLKEHEFQNIPFNETINYLLIHSNYFNEYYNFTYH